MPKTTQESLSLKIRGVYSLPNEFSEAPDGALRVANNIVLDRDSIAETRRGMRSYAQTLNFLIRRLMSFEDKLIASVPGASALYRDDNENWVQYTGTFDEPDGARIRDAQQGGSLYITSSTGIRKLDTVNGTWRDAGTPRPLDGSFALVGVTGFLPDDSSVAYRATLVYTDVNDKEIESAPSQRLVAANLAGGARNVDLTWFLPDGLTTEYSLRIFRSIVTGAALDEPDDELQQVAEIKLISADITQGFVDFSDLLPEGLRGTTLYTSPSEQGIINSNDQPPFAKDVTLFKDYLIYANVRSKQRVSVLLIGAGPGALNFEVQNGDTTSASAIVDNLTSTTDLHVGMRPKAAGIPLTARIQSIDSATQITMTEDATATATVSIEFQDLVTVAGTEYFAASATVLADQEFELFNAGTPAENIELTALSLVFTVNQDPTNTAVYGFYTSGFEDIPGDMSFEERAIGGSTYSISSTAGNSFNPDLTTSLLSSNNERQNGIIPSKFQQPDAAPVGFSLTAGVKPIQRVIALRDSCFLIGKEIYRLTGDSPQNFVVSRIDTTTKLLAPETAQLFNDRIYMMSDQGVVAVSDTGVAVESRPIEDDLQRVSSSLFPGFSEQAYAIGYESSRRYAIGVPDATSDTFATKIWVYNAFTKAWTHWDIPGSTAIVNPADDKLYIADPESFRVRQERKTFSLLDYADEEFEVTITGFSDFELSVDDTTSIEVGFLVKQTDPLREAIVEEIIDGTTLRLQIQITWDLDVATVFQPISSTITWLPITGGNPGVVAHWSEINTIFRNPDVRKITVGYKTDFVPVDLFETIIPRDLLGGWGAAPWGSIPWGVPLRGEQVIRTFVPRDRCRSHWLIYTIKVDDVFGNYQLEGFSIKYDVMTSRFR